MATILVTDGNERAALAIVRSLGQSGHRVIVVADRDQTIAGVSRYCAARYVVPNPLTSPASFVTAVDAVAHSERTDVILPVSEAALIELLSRRDSLPGRIPWPALPDVLNILDKQKVMERAAAVGIRVPNQTEIGSRADIANALSEVRRFPVVIKPARSVVSVGSSRAKTKVLYAQSAKELAATLHRLEEEWYPLLIQDRIIGPGIGVFLLLWDNKIVATFGHRRLREKPPAGGVSVLRESVPVVASLREKSAALLRSFNWQGVAMVELKQDAGTDEPYLMEINGRFWGSLQLAIDAGVDFPQMLVDCVYGNCRQAGGDYALGVRSRWFFGDLDQLIARLRRSREFLNLDSTTSGRAKALVDFIGSTFRRDRNEILRLDDPRPALLEASQWARGIAHNALSRTVEG